MKISRSSVVVYGAIFLLLYPSIVGVIQIANIATQPESDEFPTSCDDSPYNCSRIAPNSHRSTGESELRFSNTSLLSISNSIDLWISENSLAKEVYRNEGVKMEVHIVVKTNLLRFADDLFLHVECDGADAVVWIHSESRLGVSDVGTNGERIEDIKDKLTQNSVVGTSCS
ncbi:MAG: hypothetical protein CL977_03465 [Euryarchaeota archaeon]|nr:hypothetical protein [Euryarchaeota archaeon]